VRDGFVPDAVLLDLGLPDMDGFQVARALCAALPRRPLVVAVTGHGNLHERTRRERFDRYFLKPVDPTELLDALAAHHCRRASALGAS
jgi:DNA-binding response OmpR family regulator